jgi:hypothetical protein
LICKLKREEELEKVMSSVPNLLVESRDKVMGWEKNKREEKTRMLKQHYHQCNKLRYAPNKWSEQLEEEDHRRKEEEREISQRKIKQLQARIAYGELVKNTYLPRRRDHRGGFSHQIETDQEMPKLTTSQNQIQLPKIKSSSSRVGKDRASHESSA